MAAFSDRIKHAWNAFLSRDPTEYKPTDLGMISSYRPDRPRLTHGNKESIVNAIYNRISIDVCSIDIRHVRVDDDDRYTETIKSSLNECLTKEANIDQTGKQLIQDIVLSMFDEGCVAVVPTDTSVNPRITNSYDILTLRTGKIIEWHPKHVRVRVYNERTGTKDELLLPKERVAIIENPFYSVMNEPNSTLQRLIRAINRMDLVNEQNSSGKLDLIIQLPYVIRNDARKEQADKRRKEIESQLVGSKYGIAYTDGTEHITQLNRSVENNLWTQVKDLTDMLYAQLGLTPEVFNGTADDAVMTSYFSRTISPILCAITEEMERKFLTQTARTQGQAIRFFRDPFGLVPVEKIAEIADKFTRNEIASSNEMRTAIGWKPVLDPRADELRNKNINQSSEEQAVNAGFGGMDQSLNPEPEQELPV